jgi:hypothetical protein
VATEYYWFNPKTNTLFGPGPTHESIANNIEELEAIFNSFNPTLTNNEKLINMGWCRIYYNRTTCNLGVQTNCNMSARKATKYLIRKQKLAVHSMFLDVSQLSVRKSMDENDIKCYLKSGKINLD